jgi:hypothetical protein
MNLELITISLLAMVPGLLSAVASECTLTPEHQVSDIWSRLTLAILLDICKA